MTLNEREFLLLRDLIREESGIHVADEKAYLVEWRLGDLAKANGCTSFEELYVRARSGGARLREEIVDAIATKETLWFRDRRPWAVFEDLLLPRLHNELASGPRADARIWSAGCSTGQEPYSLSISIHEHLERTRAPDSLRARFRIVATDVSPSAIQTARTGRYDSLAMSRGLDDGLRRKYLREDGAWGVIDPRVAELVDFRQANLMEDFAGLGEFDVIFCRNVFIYLAQGVRAGLLARLARALRSDGALFLGASEPLVGRFDGLVRSEHAGAIYYRPGPGGSLAP